MGRMIRKSEMTITSECLYLCYLFPAREQKTLKSWGTDLNSNQREITGSLRLGRGTVMYGVRVRVTGLPGRPRGVWGPHGPVQTILKLKTVTRRRASESKIWIIVIRCLA